MFVSAAAAQATVDLHFAQAHVEDYDNTHIYVAVGLVIASILSMAIFTCAAFAMNDGDTGDFRNTGKGKMQFQNFAIFLLRRDGKHLVDRNTRECGRFVHQAFITRGPGTRSTSRSSGGVPFINC